MNQAVLKNHPSSKDFFFLYLKEVPVVYASVQEPKKKFEGNEKEYCLTAFVNNETRAYLEDTILVNKQLHKVGVDKNKKRQIKYQTSDQREDKKDMYDPYKGLNGVSLTRPELKKDGSPNPVIVVDKNGEKFGGLVGNGSICSIKCFGYRNKEGLLNIQMELVKVDDLVEYSGSNGSYQDDELGVSLSKGSIPAKEEKPSNFDDFDKDEPF